MYRSALHSAIYCVVSLVAWSSTYAAPPAAQVEQDEVSVVEMGQANAFPEPIPTTTLEQYRIGIDQGLIQKFSTRLGSLNSSISTIKLGGRSVILYRGLGTVGPLVIEYAGVVGGKGLIVSCISYAGVPFDACRRKAEQVFGAATDNSQESAGEVNR